MGGKLRLNISGCDHGRTITTITAGLARVVCELCGHVSVRFVESAVQVYPAPKRATVVTASEPVSDIPETVRRKKCRLCNQAAMFIIPDGMVCDEHAWQAAARLKWDVDDPWVPIRLDRSEAQPGRTHTD